MAKRDGWRVCVDKRDVFIMRDGGCRDATVEYDKYTGRVTISGFRTRLTPERAIRFADKIRAIAERAAKEAEDE